MPWGPWDLGRAPALAVTAVSGDSSLSVQLLPCRGPVERLIDNIPHTRVGPSPIHGHGLFAEVAFGEGQILGILDGQRVRWAEHPEVFEEEWNAVSDEILLVRGLRTKYAFINHARDPSCVIDERDMSIRARRPIDEDEELTLDYRARPLPPPYLDLERTAFLREGDEDGEDPPRT